MLCLRKNFLRDSRGSVLLEFSVTAFLLLLLTVGAFDFYLAFMQWNAATKAVQLGARLAAVSDPVCDEVTTWTGLEGGAAPGSAPPAYEWVYDGSGGGGGGCTVNNGAIDRLLNGRGAGGVGSSATFPGMRDILRGTFEAGGAGYRQIDATNLIVRYTGTGLGFAGRPLGPVPTVMVEVTGLNFNFFFLNGLLGFGPIAMPRLHTTVTGEDLSFSGT